MPTTSFEWPGAGRGAAPPAPETMSGTLGSAQVESTSVDKAMNECSSRTKSTKPEPLSVYRMRGRSADENSPLQEGSAGTEGGFDDGESDRTLVDLAGGRRAARRVRRHRATHDRLEWLACQARGSSIPRSRNGIRPVVRAVGRGAAVTQSIPCIRTLAI